jgi:hypothetical protein
LPSVKPPVSRAQSRLREIPKTFSAGPCSFSSQELWFTAFLPEGTASNLWLTHGTVESPATLSLAALFFPLWRTALSNQFSGFDAQHLSLAEGGSPKAYVPRSGALPGIIRPSS